MCPPSSASSSGENTLDHPSSKSRANGPGGAESSAAHSETAAKPAADNSGISSSGGGNNTRSFRFLLTLALRKAQTAVTLDNGGHVDEAIRTYREAISMLGLVLNRTNEEDGRQRLLHFMPIAAELLCMHLLLLCIYKAPSISRNSSRIYLTGSQAMNNYST
ncbi:hypothetical protein GGI25_002699 [Coemansia spiralis]|uniref:MIT domain-containing protein n=1 Tax=Coemansia spiralis TaxID=417178 RepID=A0A9W8KZ52_9FUNG|nr:hypothetical protein GGI25_002699 [Coemansia spiralis]